MATDVEVPVYTLVGETMEVDPAGLSLEVIQRYAKGEYKVYCIPDVISASHISADGRLAVGVVGKQAVITRDGVPIFDGRIVGFSVAAKLPRWDERVMEYVQGHQEKEIVIRVRMPDLNMVIVNPDHTVLTDAERKTVEVVNTRPAEDFSWMC